MPVTAETRDLQQRWWSWRDVLKAAPKLGIPHFQRGMVWEASNRVALLESMYEASPCGMFVVWRPDDEHAGGDIGVSILTELPLGGPEVMWLVDGQQRSRSLVSIFRECVVAEESVSRRPVMVQPEVLLELKELLFGETVADEDEEPVQVDLPDSASTPASDSQEDALPNGPEKGPPCWYVCIPALVSPTNGPNKWWRDLATTARVRRYSPFRTFKESALVDVRSVAPRGLLPMALFMAKEAPFSDSKVDALIGLLETKNLDGLQREAPWGPLWLTGQAKRWDATTEEVAPLVEWMKALRQERTASDRPLGNVLDRLFKMFREQRFGVGELPRSDLPSAVAAYVRINRAGVRVQAEERAMAALLRWHPGLLDDLATFLRRRDGLDHGSASRAHLSHASDKTFGFGLWTQVVARYVVLQEFSTVGGIRWLGPDVLEKWTVTQGLEAAAEEPGGRDALGRRIREAAQRASSALLFLDGLLSRELSLDHRMARPDVRQLWPLLEVLARVPANQLDTLKSDAIAREAVAHLLQVVMLRGYIDQADMLGLCEAIHRESMVGDTLNSQLGSLLRCCVGKMSEQDRAKPKPSATPTPEAPLAALTQNARESFKELVESSRSLQHPAVGWLYALERRGEARDCDWQHQLAAYQGSTQRGIKRGIKHLPEVSQLAPLAASMYGGKHRATPEKQHIVPFADARKITNKGGTRATASRANDIGNLTWISSLQNGLDYGFADRWMALDHTSDQGNFEARGLLYSDRSGKTAAALFEELALAVESGGHKDAQESFATFCTLRREWIKKAMDTWLDTPLTQEAMALLQP